MRKINIALVAPAGYAPDPAAFERGIARLEAAGCSVHNYYDPARKSLRFGGTDAGRARQLLDACRNPAVDVIMAVRGSYGISRLLELVDWAELAASNKLWVGYSDVTALHCALMSVGGDGCFAGPMLCDDFTREDTSGFSLNHFWQCLQQPETTLHIDSAAVQADGAPPLAQSAGSDPAAGGGPSAGAGAPAEGGGGTQHGAHAGPAAHIALAPASAANPRLHCEGTLWGGNLAMLVSLLGTPYFPCIEGGILFIEDVAEHPYRVERMLLHLHHAGVLARQKAVILGNFTQYRLSPYDNGYSFDTMLAYVRARLPVPILTGLPFGHGKERVTLPLGCTAELHAGDQHFSLKMRGYRFLG